MKVINRFTGEIVHEDLSAVLAVHAKRCAGAGGTHANLTDAYLAHANLAHANLTGANLTDAILTHANLTHANLTGIRDDFRAVLDAASVEVPGLLAALRNGRVNGSTYHGPCACLIGTIAILRKCNYQSLGDLRPDSSRPAERWFLAIGLGATPDNNLAAAITEGWILEWQAERGLGDLIKARPW